MVPAYGELFERQNIKLPVLALQAIQLSRFAVEYWYAIVPLGAVLDAIVLTLLTRSEATSKWLLAICSHGCLLAALVLVCWVSFVLSFPVRSMPLDPTVEPEFQVPSAESPANYGRLEPRSPGAP